MFRVSVGQLFSQSTEASVSKLYGDTMLSTTTAGANITISLKSGKLAEIKAAKKKTKEKAKALLV